MVPGPGGLECVWVVCVQCLFLLSVVYFYVSGWVTTTTTSLGTSQLPPGVGGLSPPTTFPHPSVRWWFSVSGSQVCTGSLLVAVWRGLAPMSQSGPFRGEEKPRISGLWA